MTEKNDIVPKILKEKFPQLCEKYIKSSKDIETTLECLPHSKHGLPVLFMVCSRDLLLLETEINEKLWGDYTNSVEMEQLKCALLDLKSRIVEKARSLNVDLEDSPQENIDADNHTSLNKHGALESSNCQHSSGISDDTLSNALLQIKPVAKILTEKFKISCLKHTFIIDEGRDVL